MSISPVNQLSAEHYKDRSVGYIGHGRLESAPETMSALHVIAHELGHVTEFKNEAIREGRDIQTVQVKINYEIRDGRMVAVSGETRAVTRSKEKEDIDPSLVPYSDGKTIKDLFQKKEEEKSKEDKSIITEKKNEAIRKEELETRIKNLDEKLDNEKSKVETKQTSNNGLKSEIEKEIEAEKSRLEEEVRYLKMKESLKENFELLSDFRKMMTSNLFGMVSFGNQTNSGSLLDTFV
ncbi:hypothetical protein P3G55_15010 [Leptospira sp. 96542]|nr:hypothetical protein [Leptospira sp. 96542]